MTCGVCAAKFTFKEQDNQYGLVDRREIKDREERYEAYKTGQAELQNSAQAKEVVSRFISLLDNQRSVAAIHRFLQSHRLVYESYGTFVKKWKGAEAWVKDYLAFHAATLPELSEIVGLEDKYLSETASKLKMLWADYQQPFTFHGEALLDISGYR